jgi:hypothetical protein
MALFNITKTPKTSFWTTEDDQILLQHSHLNQKNKWTEIAKLLPGKTPYQCNLRFRGIRPGLKKGSWSDEEDELIKSGIKLYGKQWALIAKYNFINRNSKQIRDRYTNYLDPKLKKGKFTTQEDILIYQLYERLGPKWSRIQRYIKNRSADAIKNRYKSSIRNKQMSTVVGLIKSDKVKLFLIFSFYWRNLILKVSIYL